ncbi:MAG: hypothetical protein Q8O67_31730 [Deltaproteobacteria bacterium]|nr:hypothetical protein [Deltaproteobacteria bacterium]
MDLNFTLVFKPLEGQQVAYELKYEPTPTWRHNGHVVKNMKDHNGTSYQDGGIAFLLDHHATRVGPVERLAPNCALIYDRNLVGGAGFDSADVIGKIVADLRSHNFVPTLVAL